MPIHILWINLVTDALPALALGVDEATEDLMNRPPKDKSAGVFSGGLGRNIIFHGLIQTVLTMSAFYIGYINYSPEVAITMTFATLGLIQLVHAFNVHAQDKSIFTVGVHNNFLIGAILISAFLQIIVILVPSLNTLFQTKFLKLEQWGIVVGLSLLILVAVEIDKLVRRRLKN